MLKTEFYLKILFLLSWYMVLIISLIVKCNIYTLVESGEERKTIIQDILGTIGDI